jgi:hypothetical protein
MARPGEWSLKMPFIISALEAMRARRFFTMSVIAPGLWNC